MASAPSPTYAGSLVSEAATEAAAEAAAEAALILEAAAEAALILEAAVEAAEAAAEAFVVAAVVPVVSPRARVAPVVPVVPVVPPAEAPTLPVVEAATVNEADAGRGDGRLSGCRGEGTHCDHTTAEEGRGDERAGETLDLHRYSLCPIGAGGVMSVSAAK
jgi:hypothetical protein